MSNGVLGPWGEPASVVIAGDFGMGKSRAALLAAGGLNFVAFGPAGTGKAVLPPLGIEIGQYRPLYDLEQLALGLDQVAAFNAQAQPQDRIQLVVAEELDTLAKNTERTWRKQERYGSPSQAWQPPGKDPATGKPWPARRKTDLMRFWPDFYDLIYRCFSAHQRLGVFFYGVGHADEPCWKKGRDKVPYFVDGGIRMPSRGARMKVAEDVSSCFPVVADKEKAFFHHSRMFSVAFICETPKQNWISKDRHGLGAYGKLPANLPEVLHHVGYRIPVHPVIINTRAAGFDESWYYQLVAAATAGLDETDQSFERVWKHVFSLPSVSTLQEARARGVFYEGHLNTAMQAACARYHLDYLRKNSGMSCMPPSVRVQIDTASVFGVNEQTDNTETGTVATATATATPIPQPAQQSATSKE